MGVVASLTGARLRRHPAGWLLLASGAGLALALPVLAAATGRVVAGQTLQNAVSQLPVGERTVVAAYGGTQDVDQQARDDATVRGGLARLTGLPVSAQMLFGEISDGAGVTFRLGASDALDSQVRLTSGRLPASCTPTRCEVVATGTSRPPALDPALGLVVVGSAVRTDPLLLPGTFDPGPDAYVLLSSDPAALQRLEALTRFPRGAGWVGAIDPRRIAGLGVPAYAELSRTVADELAADVDTLVLAVPDDVLLREDARAAASQGRFALIGGASAALVLGFVLVAATGLRRDHREAAALLRRRGASRRTRTSFALAGPAVAILLGAVLGMALGWVAAYAVTSAQPLHASPAGEATRAVLDALPSVLVLGGLAIALTAAVLLWPATRAATAWHVVEAVAATSVLVAALLAARGSVGVAAGSDPLAALLPVLLLLAAALVAARLWVPLASWTSRRLPAGAVAARLSAATGVHRPLRTVVTVGFLTAAVGTVVFAGAYRATLQAGSVDTAAYDVPADARLAVGPQRADPLDVVASAPLAGRSSPVLRTVAGVRETATTGAAVALLGLEPIALADMPRWERTVGASDAGTVAGLLAAAGDAPSTGTPIADSATRVSIPVRSWTRTADVGVDVVAWVGVPDGRERPVPLTLASGALTGTLPDLGPGRTLLALTLRENPADATVHAHQIGEGGTSTELPAGRVVLGPAETGSTGGWTGWTSRTGEVSADSRSLAIGYQLSGSQIVVRPAAQAGAVPVVTDPATGTPGSTLRLDLGGGDDVQAVVVATLPRFPTAGDRFVVADRARLAAALDDVEPGSGRAHEVWVSGGPSLGAALAAAPYDRLSVTTRQARLAELESDAVSQGAGGLLLVAAVVALGVGLLALVLLVVGERRDDEGELLAHEADGVATTTLRRSLWLRAVGAAVPALVAGAVAGLVLTRAVTSLVELSAGGTSPTPPLMPAVGAGWTATVLLVGVALALGVCALVVARMLRSAWPARPSAVPR